MKNAIPYNVAFGLIITFFSYSLTAQHNKVSNFDTTDKYDIHDRVGDYLELKKLGYEEREIFEDLGNANFLQKKYETAIFWYDKLKQVSKPDALSNGFNRRYQYALQIISDSGIVTSVEEENWLETIQSDYGITGEKNPSLVKYRPLDAHLQPHAILEQQLITENHNALDTEILNEKKAYKVPITVTADGKTAFFSKPLHTKPPKGIFSKKELVYKIYQAEKKDGKWQGIKELALCPKYYSALHPAISFDGKRLFFASDMPGTYGKYDIYVSNIKSDGTIGRAKNLGEKVNSRKNDLYPKIVGTNTLFFASDGRKGLGGLDVYMVQVNEKRVGLAINLGGTLNSKEDDFSIRFMPQMGMAYVISNRGKDQADLQQVAFSYNHLKADISEEKTAYNVLEALNKDSKIDYSSSVFEDE
jgi:hypothetical protein